MEEFKAVLGIIQAMGKEATVELLKSRFVKVCIGLSLLAWATGLSGVMHEAAVLIRTIAEVLK